MCTTLISFLSVIIISVRVQTVHLTLKLKNACFTAPSFYLFCIHIHSVCVLHSIVYGAMDYAVWQQNVIQSRRNLKIICKCNSHIYIAIAYPKRNRKATTITKAMKKDQRKMKKKKSPWKPLNLIVSMV